MNNETNTTKDVDVEVTEKEETKMADNKEKVAVDIFGGRKTIKVSPKLAKPVEIGDKVLVIAAKVAAVAGAGFVGYKLGVKHIGALKDIEIGKLKATIDEIKSIELPKQELIETAGDVVDTVADVVEETVEAVV